MRRGIRWYLGALILAGACTAETNEPWNPSAMDSGVICVDSDKDGFGHNCAKGRDCDDHNPASTNECRECLFPELGCACDPAQEPISCFLKDLPTPEGNVMCREGTRYCRAGLWSTCEDVHSYEVTPDPTLTSLINPDASPENCSLCLAK